jgi:hypothetical protein
MKNYLYKLFGSFVIVITNKLQQYPHFSYQTSPEKSKSLVYVLCFQHTYNIICQNTLRTKNTYCRRYHHQPIEVPHSLSIGTQKENGL